MRAEDYRPAGAMISDQQLLRYAKRGLLVGPDETEEAFLKRIGTLSSREPFSLFEYTPDWIDVSYENKGLLPWEGGCVFLKENGFCLQLRRAFLKKDSFFFYSKQEILSHEIVHVMRMAFEEPQFEEILAYQTSKNRFRRIFGPFFRSSRESTGMLLLITLASIGGFFSPYASLAPVLPIGYGFFRLFRTQTLFRGAKRCLQKRFNSSFKALSFLFLMTDEEIREVAKIHDEKTLDYLLLEKKKDSLRGRQMSLLYQNFLL